MTELLAAGFTDSFRAIHPDEVKSVSYTHLVGPLLIEQFLAVTVGMADTMMVSRCGEAAISGVSLVDMINNLIIVAIDSSQTHCSCHRRCVPCHHEDCRIPRCLLHSTCNR